jgi:hypothetical protein
LRRPFAAIPRRRPAAAALSLCLAACATAPLWAQQPPKRITGIYTCIDEKGRRLTADRPIPECAGKEQQVLNRDGSLRTVLPPTLTAEERAEAESRDRARALERAAQADAVRRDRNLTARYPDEARHQAARLAALNTVQLAMRATEARLRELAAERKPLRDEAEFYEGKALPPKLKAAMDANDASVEAQRSAAASQEAELGRINKLYDAELERLRQLWAGAAPGSLGPLPAVPAARPASASAQAATPAKTR